MDKIKLLIECYEQTYEECKRIQGLSETAFVIANGIPYNPSGDSISREALKEDISKVVAEERKEDEKWAAGLRYALTLIDNAPPVEDRPQGVWVDSPDGLPKCCCSLCGAKNVTIWRSFCPNCGASMQGGAE